jgi:TPR repeat protein
MKASSLQNSSCLFRESGRALVDPQEFVTKAWCSISSGATTLEKVIDQTADMDKTCAGEVLFHLGKRFVRFSGHSEAVRLFRLAAEGGHAEAQYHLSLFYKEGVIVDKDRARFLMWCTSSANQGNIGAQAVLGDAYNRGEGIAQDRRHAAELFASSAYRGDEGAQYELGVMHIEGRVVSKDTKEAMRLFRWSVQNGFMPPLVNLATLCRLTT